MIADVFECFDKKSRPPTSVNATEQELESLSLKKRFENIEKYARRTEVATKEERKRLVSVCNTTR